MRTPPTRGGAAKGIDETAWLGSSLNTLPRRQAPARQPRRPETGQARLQEHVEHLAWAAYCRALRLQEDEPSPETLIIRNATYDVWKRALLADERRAT